LKQSLKTKLSRYNDDDDVEECQYVWQENELADFGQWLQRQLLLLVGEGRGGKRPGSTCLLITAHLPSQWRETSTPWDHGHSAAAWNSLWTTEIL